MCVAGLHVEGQLFVTLTAASEWVGKGGPLVLIAFASTVPRRKQESRDRKRERERERERDSQPGSEPTSAHCDDRLLYRRRRRRTRIIDQISSQLISYFL